MKWKPYPTYVDSGVDLIGPIPAHWKAHRIKHLANVRLSNVDKLAVEGEAPVRLANYVDVYKNERITADMELMAATASADQIARLSLQAGDVLITKDSETPDDIGVPAFVPETVEDVVCGYHLAMLRPDMGRLHGAFLHRWLQGNIAKAHFTSHATGMTRYGLGKGDIGDAPVMWAPLEEQAAISAFLDRETSKIDTLIAEQGTLIERLKEWQIAMTSQVVTKGMSPDVPKKDSGLMWLGEVPEHWTMKRLRALFRQEKRQDQVGKPVLSVYRDYGVIFKNSRDDNNNKTPENLSLYQLVNKGDLVVNKMKAWQGSLGVSNLDGITSPDYAVFTPLHQECSAFIHLLLRSERVVSLYRSISNGIRPDQWRLEPDQFLNMYVPLPPLSEQGEISSHVESLARGYNALAEEAKKAIELLAEHRSALITAVVTGKVDVRGAVA